jgi:hypothetical protein
LVPHFQSSPLSLQPCPPPACTALSSALGSAGRLASQLPSSCFRQLPVHRFLARRSLLLAEPVARFGLSLALSWSALSGCLAPGSMVPASSSRPCLPVLPPVRPLGSTATPGSPRSWRLLCLAPVAASLAGSPSCFPSVRSPSGRSHPSGSMFPLVPPPDGPPSGCARFPFAPRRHCYF